MDQWGSAGLCDADAINQAGEAISEAIADFYAKALGSVVCEGQSFFCGWNVVGLEDWVSRTVEDSALVGHLSSVGSMSKEFCYGDLRNVSEGLEDSISSAQSLTCTVGGTPEDFSASLASAIAPIIQRALVRATAADCGEQHFCSTAFTAETTLSKLGILIVIQIGFSRALCQALSCTTIVLPEYAGQLYCV